ncbi:hypothetical protein F443_00748 [Plasmopara halstedii]|uniref:PX domain-containing protein n=1 Tax=Plasmopara halstedii TaxID=4781 RepID=A0A0P1AVW5_PLAHL|nr:hypothetical protein F443_00748 [Plasmopara halstedii]CEG45127.1 hypothetical protein F443_00748 [Plasmopara halstedii]|eukprot:XP_024581496.1 hypothetical protein F443_00748 [Plasmopara halstedii]
MGCNQSKVNADIIESVTTSPSEYGKASSDLASTEIMDGNEKTSTSIPPAPVENLNGEKEADAITDEEPMEHSIAQSDAIEESVVIGGDNEPFAADEVYVAADEVSVAADEVSVAADEVPVAADEVSVAADGPIADQAPVDACECVTLEVDEAQVESAPIVEVNEELVVEPEVEVEEVHYPVVVKKSALTSVEAPVWTFVAHKVSFIVGVAFFNITGCNSDGDEVQLTKRYSEFKVLYDDIIKLMSSEDLPCMPRTSFLQSRNDKALLQERENTFVEMLNAMARHPDASQSASFQAFLA